MFILLGLHISRSATFRWGFSHHKISPADFITKISTPPLHSHQFVLGSSELYSLYTVCSTRALYVSEKNKGFYDCPTSHKYLRYIFPPNIKYWFKCRNSWVYVTRYIITYVYSKCNKSKSRPSYFTSKVEHDKWGQSFLLSNVMGMEVSKFLRKTRKDIYLSAMSTFQR